MSEYLELPTSVKPFPLSAALSMCECYCIANCCGMNAYDINVESMQYWANTVTADDVEHARRQVDVALNTLKSAPEAFYYLDGEHLRSEVEEWFWTVRAALAEVRLPA